MRGIRAPHVLAAVLGTTAVAALAAACGGSTTPGRSAPRSAPQVPGTSASASAAQPTAGRQALAAYEAMWGDIQATSETADYQDPRLSAHLAGQALLTVSENMAVEKADGIIALGTPVVDPSVITSSPTVVTVRDCMSDVDWLQYYVATRKLVNTVPGGHRYVAATVTDQDGTWKVTSLDARGEGTC
jgi:hypothetical protein